MYHPTRGGVRGGRDQFTWEDVKVDKHRENYLGHSIKAPVGRWQKGKDLHWYNRDKNGNGSGSDALKEEIQRIKEQEEQAMREALGLAPKSAPKPQGNRLDKHEFKELIKRASTAEDVGGGHAEAARVHGLGHTRLPKPWEKSSFVEAGEKEDVVSVSVPASEPSGRKHESEESEDERSGKRRRREEKKRDKQEHREKRRARDSEDKKPRKHKEKRRHDSD